VQLGCRQVGVPAALGLLQDVDDRRSMTARRVLRDAVGAGDRVRGLEADAVLLGQAVGIVANQGDRVGAMALVQRPGEPARPVRGEQQVEVAQRTPLPP
jgi:hypothetical protein